MSTLPSSAGKAEHIPPIPQMILAVGDRRIREVVLAENLPKLTRDIAFNVTRAESEIRGHEKSLQLDAPNAGILCVPFVSK